MSSPPPSSSPTSLDNTFHSAANWLSSSPSAADLSNNLKLEIYGIYKLVTSGIPSTDSAPPFFSLPTTKAKHSSWVSISKQYADDLDAARRRYIDIAIDIGFDDREAGTGKGAGVGGGAVSVMKLDENEGEDEEEEKEPIIIASMNNNPTLLIDLLEQDGSLLNYQDSEKMTPLHYAVDRGHLSIVKILVERGADQTIKDVDDMTAYDVAMINGRKEVLELLIKPGI